MNILQTAAGWIIRKSFHEYVLAIVVFGALLLPDLWRTFYKDFQNGRQVKPISTWTIEEYAMCCTSTLWEVVFSYTPQRQELLDIRTETRFGVYTAIAAGSFGMLFCLPFLFSSSMEDLVGAGFPFLAGVIMASAGLVALLTSRK
ncbi:hypothetical protein [Chitinophaga agri]|uniref:Uncharacterized protein n=1 Tax=Chitinophaga agri TaxID=2703787 RepID=A0A6B9ZDY7_9BACT|nr:hypothetical protein [Chitinophaga agri]QHS59355.1 hypothetical protein GWR21_07080 [Chitinophaga agri]